MLLNALHLQKINLGVISENKVAVKLYENLGFKIEGVLRKNYFNKSSDEYNGRKGIFSLPVAYTVKNIEEQKFFSMVITLYIKKFDKLNYEFKPSRR